MAKKNYKKLKGAVGIYQNLATKKYLAEKKIKGKTHNATFTTLFEAKEWRKNFDGVSTNYQQDELTSSHSTLKEVWQVMQEEHFPSLATSTKRIWQQIGRAHV